MRGFIPHLHGLPLPDVPVEDRIKSGHDERATIQAERTAFLSAKLSLRTYLRDSRQRLKSTAAYGYEEVADITHGQEATMRIQERKRSR
jgi:hypothetical protein